MSVVIPAIQGKMGSTSYFQCMMRVDELVRSVRSASEIDDWANMSIGDKMQREPSWSRIKNQIAPNQEGDLKSEHVEEISKRLDVESDEIINMNRRMMGQEKSLNAPLKDGEKEEWQDWLVDESLDQELLISQKQEYNDKKELLKKSINILNKREKEILESRRLTENPKTLDQLSKKFKISRERIRQIETKAFEKLQKSMINASKSKNLLQSN